MRITYSDVLAITDQSMTFTFPGYFVTKPAVLVTVNNKVTEVAVQYNYQYIEGIGEVYTSITLTFPSDYVGSEFSIIVTADE